MSAGRGNETRKRKFVVYDERLLAIVKDYENIETLEFISGIVLIIGFTTNKKAKL